MSNQYLSEFQILGSSIKSLKIKNDFVAFGSDNKFKRKIDISHSISSPEATSDGESLLGTVLLNVKVTISSEKKKYVVDLAIEGAFKAPCGMGNSNFKKMMEVNGITSLYSIARGFIQSTTSQTLVSGSVLLPLFNVAAYSKDLKGEN